MSTDLTLLSGRKILLGVTGGIAAYKICGLTSTLRKAGAEVRVVMTEAARELVGPRSFQALSGNPIVDDTTILWAHNGMDHIELPKWADLFLIAPCTANMVGKLAHGIADDLISTVSLACPAPQLVSPAMNSEMWAKPSVQRNVTQLSGDGYGVIPPEKGMLACGDEGEGRLPCEEVLLEYIIRALV